MGTMNCKEFGGKVAIVTGAGQGIGRGTALELASAGAELVLANINGQTIEKVRVEVEKMGWPAGRYSTGDSLLRPVKTLRHRSDTGS